ncbi:MAG: hypothetical protein NZ989_02770 [Bacteroidia bacterium]|nr:hypothetical protein [Bacteroidia bacterium]
MGRCSDVYYIALGDVYEDTWARAGYSRRFAIFTQDGRSFSQNIGGYTRILTYASPEGRVVIIPNETTVYILDPATPQPIKASVDFPTEYARGNTPFTICGQVIPWEVKGQSRACLIQMTGGNCQQGYSPPQYVKPKYALIQW